MAYIEVQNVRIPPNDPRNQGRYLHKATIIMLSAREKRDMYFMDAIRVEHNRQNILKEFLQEQLDGDFTLTFGEFNVKGRSFPAATVCCRDINWIMMSMLIDQQWIGNHTYMVESVK